MINISRSVEAALVTGMLLAFLVVSLVLLSQKGLFIDDSMHMPAGYSYVLTHDYQLNAIALVPGLVIAVSAFPNYLTYFSPLAGGAARGWQTLSDSNVETGQEVKPLARYLKDRGENRVTGIMVGGEFLKFYGIQADDFPGWDVADDSDGDSNDDSGEADDEHGVTEPIKTKYVAIGAWYLSEVDLSDKQKEIIDRYRQQKPEVMVGNSIFVFRRQH